MQLIPGDAKKLVRCVRRVLVAEDDEDTRTLLAWGLRLHGYEVVECTDGTQLFLTFAAPEGDTFVVDFDAYIQPASQIGRNGTVAVVEPDGTQVATTSFATRIVP